MDRPRVASRNEDLEKVGLAHLYLAYVGAFELLAIRDIRARSISFASRPRRPYGPPESSVLAGLAGALKALTFQLRPAKMAASQPSCQPSGLPSGRRPED